jgi:GNAT superfamily N-acetyltransferase
VRQVDYRTASEADLAAINDVANAVATAWRPSDAPRPLAHRIAEARSLPAAYVERSWLVEADDGTPIGQGGCWFHGDASFGGAPVVEIESLDVVPAWRRRGVGSALLRRMASFAAEHGRTHLHGQVRSAVPAGAAFAEALGGRPGLEQRESELDLGALDRSLLERWIADGPVHAPGYEVVFMLDGYDPACLPAIAEAYDAMDDMPHDDLQAGTRRKSVEQLAGADAMLVGSGERRWTALAREVGSDRFAGVTEVYLRAWNPSVVQQGNTGVLSAHRGRRLGWWLKAAMLAKVLDEVPEARLVRTGNAFSNAHMLAINDALGFRVSSVTTTWEVPVTAVLAGTRPDDGRP